MHLSDVIMECSRQCAHLSRKSDDKNVAAALLSIATTLSSAVAQDAELVIGEAQTSLPPSSS